MDSFQQLLVQLASSNPGAASGPGKNVIVVGTDPAANNEVAAADFVVPAGKVWVPLSFTVVMAQGTTQTPSPALAWDDGTNTLGAAPGATAPGSVSVTSRYTWTRGLKSLPTAGAGLLSNVAVLPDLWLPAGYRLKTLTGGLGANSDYGVPIARVLEFAALSA